MMSTPEVNYSRPQHPDKTVRPPPKSFADFDDAARAAAADSKNFQPKAAETRPSERGDDAHVTRNEQRLGLLEQRIEILEGMAEELTDAATKPSVTGSSAFIAHIVRLAVVDGIISPEAALLAVARELGLVDVTSKLRAPAPSFLAPKAAPAPMVAAPEVKRRVAKEELEAPAVLEAPAEPPRSLRGGRQPTLTQQREQAAVRKTLKAFMEATQVSQNRVAAVAGIHQSAVSRFLRGGGVIDDSFIRKLEKAITKLS